MSEENEDLQSFFDNFHKEIEDGSSTVVTLTAENLATVASGDKVVQKILLEGVEVSDDEDVTYFLDDDGNCFKQSKNKQKILPKSEGGGRPVRRAAAQKANANLAKAKPDVTIKTESPEYIVRLDGYQSEEEEESADNKSKIYNFEDATEGENAEVEEGFEVSNRMIRLKPMTTASPMLSCNLCDYKTNKKFLLQRHEKTHSQEKPFKCAVCERGFKTNAALVNHVNSHNGHKPHACKSCDSAFTTSGELIRHNRYKHTGEKPHKCTECGYASVEMSKLRRHIRCHTGERPYQCPHCTYASPDTFKLKRHLRTHTGEKPYECDICKARFSQSNSLKSHRLIHSVVDKPVFQCSMCPTTCGRKSDLRLHVLNLHQSDKPIPCKRCGMKLKDRYSYKLHIKSHEGEKCFRCSLCPYASISQRHLDSHMLIHTDEKPFKCDYCELDFRQRQLLRRHININHVKDYVPPQPRNKLHVCPDCKRTFTHKGNLMRHMEVHDPTLKVLETKLELRKGRNVRVNATQPENDVISIGDEEPCEGEVIEFTEENLTEEPDDVIFERSIMNATKVRSRNNQQTTKHNTSAKDIITFRIKQEPPNDDVMSVNVEGEDQYMVLEVVNEAEYDADDDQNLASDPSKLKVSATKDKHTKISVDNCFGFEMDDEDGSYGEEDYNDVENKEFIQLMDILQ